MAVMKENYEIVQLLLSNDKIDVNVHNIYIKNIYTISKQIIQYNFQNIFDNKI